ncbi:MAG: hypothetical protein ACI88A_001811 [Paraglaciecola sp.]|jgi:hypothetical protein
MLNILNLLPFFSSSNNYHFKRLKLNLVSLA